MGLGFTGDWLLAGFDLPMRAVGRRMEIRGTGRLRSTGREQARFGPRGRGARASSAAWPSVAGSRAQYNAKRRPRASFLLWAELTA
jgi:hypothetical protein